MKRILSIILIVSMMFGLCACGSGAPSGDSEENKKNTIFKSDDDPVEIHLQIMDLNGVGGEAYVEELKTSDPEGEYKYYDEEYYIQVITEGERKEMLKGLKDVNAVFGEAFNEDYPDMFIKAELNHKMNELTLHLNNEKIKEYPMSGLAILLVGAAYLDNIQAYNLVLPEDRDGRMICKDETGEIILDTDEINTEADETSAE